MLLKVILITCLGALQIAADSLLPTPFGPSEMVACGGSCEDDQYLVCGKGFERPYFRSFPNHCYMDAANQCIKSKLNNAIDPYFLEAPDVLCDYHKSYTYFESLTCEQYTPMGIKQKENYIKEINVITTASDPLSDVTATLASLEISADFNSEIVALQQQLADILVYTDCPTCTEPTKHRYRECSKVEEEKFRQAIFEFDDELKTYISQNLSNVEPKRFVKYLIKQTENMINKLLSVRAIREYYDKKLESFHTVYVETKRKLENYIITNDIYAVGKTIVDSLRIAVGKLNPNPRCRIVSELNGLSDETVQIITPFSASKYLQPSLNSFARKYGGATDTGDLESVRSYERVFGSAEQTLLNSSRMNGPSLALDSLRNVLRSIDEFLGNASTCLGSVLTDEDGDVYDLLLCLSEANFKSSDIATLRISLSQCYGNYQMKAYCLGGISRLPEVTRYNELVSCLSIALKSPNKDDVACCFK